MNSFVNKMFGQLMKRVLTKYETIKLMRNSERLTARYLREIELKKEIKLQTIREIIIEKNVSTNGNIEWNQLIKQLIDQKLVFSQNFEVSLMSAFHLDNQNETQINEKMDKKLFLSLMNFIKELPNIRNNSIAASRFCLFVSQFPQYIDEITVNQIRETADKLIESYSKNSVTNNVIYDSIIALAKSSKDNCLYAIDLLPKLQVFRTNDQFMNTLIYSSLKFKLFDHSFRLINTNTDFKLNAECVENCVNAIIESNLDFKQTINLFNTFSKTLIVFDSTLEPKLMNIMKRFGFKTHKTFVEQNGLCHKCGHTLKGLTTEEYITLRNELRSVVFNKKDNLLLASFPEYEQELNNFDKFMQKITANKPLDLVIDGLNIAYKVSPKYIPDKRKLRNFVKVYSSNDIDEQSVEILLRNKVFDNYENILLIGRKHMKNWKKLNVLLEVERDRISCFYAMNKTKDDTYILYAAIQNQKTNIVSSDFYRDYSDKMANKNMATLFNRWLRTHQILVEDNKYMKLPDQYDYTTHISPDNKTIHLPFANSNSDKNQELKWICCLCIS